MLRKMFASSCLAALLAASAANAAPAIIASDVETGAILSANNIDIKQDPYLIGKLGVLFLALNDVMTGEIDPDTELSIPGDQTASFADLLAVTIQEDINSPLATTLIAGAVAQSPNILNERMNALFRKIGMRATEIRTVRTQTGEPSWSGFTTARDIARLSTALILTHGDYAKAFLPRSPQSVQDNWYYRDGMCLLVAKAPSSQRSFVAVIHGASTEKNCLDAALKSVIHNDDRITTVIKR